MHPRFSGNSLAATSAARISVSGGQADLIIIQRLSRRQDGLVGNQRPFL